MFCFKAFLAVIIADTIVRAFVCRELLQDEHIQYIEWINLEQCLKEVNSEILPKSTSANIWRLMKVAFDGIENIPAEAYVKLVCSLVEIPINELRNISMEQVETVEAFGKASSSIECSEFSNEQMMLIAQKVRHEWLGKNPQTYSEFDLITMGAIVCYLNVSDIAKIHADAFKEAVEWIGVLENCPHDRLEAFAKLAMSDDAFGTPAKWTKLEVSIVGNIINGLSAKDIETIDSDKLHLNHFYTQNDNKTTSSLHKQLSYSKKFKSTIIAAENTNKSSQIDTSTKKFV